MTTNQHILIIDLLLSFFIFYLHNCAYIRFSANLLILLHRKTQQYDIFKVLPNTR